MSFIVGRLVLAMQDNEAYVGLCADVNVRDFEEAGEKLLKNRLKQSLSFN